MGQKVNPIGIRVGIIRDWDARWYADDKNYVDLLHEDFKVRKFVKDKLFDSGIARIVIERTGNTKIKVTIHTATVPQSKFFVENSKNSPASLFLSVLSK